MSKKQNQPNNNKSENGLLDDSADTIEVLELKTKQETELEDLEYIEKKPFFKRAWEWLTKDKQRLASIVFLFLFVVLIIVLAALNLNLGEIMRNIVDWFQMKLGIWGILVGVFVISIFGNFTVIFPIPYTLALVTAATDPTITAWHVIVMGVFAGAGASIGEVSAWFLGKASKNVIEDGMEKQVSRAQRWIDKGLAPIIIFVFAATPLPDDAILVFIGLLGYALWKTVIWCFLGKIVLTSATGLAAKYLGETAFGEKVLWLFGLKIGGSGVTASEPAAWISALVWVASIAIIGVVLFIDWGDIWNFLSRSVLKRKYRKLAISDKDSLETTTVSEVKLQDEGKQSIRKQRLLKEASFWQCVISKKDDETSDYFDLYSVSYVLGKASNILLKPDWFAKFSNNLTGDKFSKLNEYQLDKLLPPKKIKEFYESNKKLDEITSNMIYLSFTTNHVETNTDFRVGFLLEKIKQDQIKVRCIGEKEALIIKSLKSISPELMITNLVKFLDHLSETPELVKKIDVAFIS
ncbi:MAG: YqaA family protein [Candidatus Heimdallarchaeota archaeon]